MSWVYWEPKSSMSIFSECISMTVVRESGSDLLLVVWSLFGDGHVVDVALAQARRGNLHEPGLPVELRYGLRAAVAHACPQAAYELEDGSGYGPLVRHPALDALWHELQFALDVFLEVPVLAALLHGLYGAHARPYPCRAYRAGADPDLYGVNARLYERLRGLGGGDVAGDELAVEALPGGADCLERAL